ncbi:MAG: element excision factor XisH family protein [Chloroflexi bacterium]|nr:element excision factor XisH family protein [Chloroflexota bacterium]
MAKDVFHESVKIALQKEGWLITHDPLPLTSMGFNILIDLGAKELLAAEKDGREIAVEIKSFIGSSNISQFHIALGQFLNYRDALNDEDPSRKLFLAIPNDAYETTFQIPFIQRAIDRYDLDLIVYDPLKEVIVKWKS